MTARISLIPEERAVIDRAYRGTKSHFSLLCLLWLFPSSPLNLDKIV